ncbi:hypothetical protein [Paenibacillus sp. VT-400]|nr:hypothetical protein [Paenibacillus sp. VT-400]
MLYRNGGNVMYDEIKRLERELDRWVTISAWLSVPWIVLPIVLIANYLT